MYYVIMYSYTPEQRDAINARFLETGGPPPEGVKMVGRWSLLGMQRGVCVAQSDNPEAVGKWAQAWSDLMTFEVYPALDDEATARVIA
jgi:hypothetical protein